MRFRRAAASFLAVAAFSAAAFADQVTTRGGDHVARAGFVRLVFDWTQDVEAHVEATDDRVRVTFGRPIETDLRRALQPISDYVESGEVSADGGAVVLAMRAPVEPSLWRDGPKVVLDLTLKPKEEAEPEVAEATPPAFARPGVAAVAVRPGEDAALAAFEAGGSLWLAFDRRLKNPDSDVVAELKATLGGGDLVEDAPTTAYRFPAPAGGAPKVWRDGDQWLFDFAVAAKPERITLDRKEGVAVAPVADVERVVVWDHPDLGRLYLAPSRASEASGAMRLVQAEFLPALQGVAVRARADGVSAKLTEGGVAIVAPEGLLLGEDRAQAEPSPEKKQMFLFDAWRAEAEVLGADVGAVGKGGELQAARRLFAIGRAKEAAMAVDALAAARDGALDVDARALRGAARVWTGAVGAGLKDLSAPDLAAAPEAALWRGLAYAIVSDWPAAEAEFARGGAIADSYPAPFFLDFAVARAETALASGDAAAALALLDAAMARDPAGVSSPAALFLRAEALKRVGDEASAASLLRRVAIGEDSYFRTMAEAALIERAVDVGEMSARDAAEKLAALRRAAADEPLGRHLAVAAARRFLKAGDLPAAFASYGEALEGRRDRAVASEAAAAFVGRFFAAAAADEDAAVRLAEALPPGDLRDGVLGALGRSLLEDGRTALAARVVAATP